jgi:hypothetical protein
MRIRTFRYLLPAAFAIAQGFAQDFRSLEGTTVSVRIDMPASSDGVEIRNGQADFRKISDRIRQYGVGVHSGQSIAITKIIVKSKNIEVHLGGGGFGTFSDRLAVAAASNPASYEGKTRREKDLEDELKYTNDYWTRVRIRRELDDLQRDRERNNATTAAINAQTRQLVEANVMQKRAEAGSRFNIRYDNGVPPDGATPAAIMASLSKYVDFGGGGGSAPPIHFENSAPGVPDGPAPALRKGLTVVQTEQILGPASKVSQKNEGSLEISVREYMSSGQHVTTQFVGGVLVDYKITPR